MRWKVEVLEDAPYVVAPVVRVVEAGTWREAVAAAMEEIPNDVSSSMAAQVTAEPAR